MQEKDKIMQFIQKNISSSESNQKIHCEFDLKFELSRVDTLKEKVKSLEQDIEEYKRVI
jgi:deferrochelatase/peroxidase EfeB